MHKWRKGALAVSGIVDCKMISFVNGSCEGHALD